MTAQEVFDKVVNHLRQQGRKSVNSVGECRYRGNKNAECPMQCAAGCLIEDNEYNDRMEGKCFKGLLDWEFTPQSLVDRLLPHDMLITQLQYVHDDELIEHWENNFKIIASYYNIEYKEP